MTGPAGGGAAGDEELRWELLDAIARSIGEDPAMADPDEVDDLMRHLVPVVSEYAERQARQAAAAELERAIRDVQAVYDLQCPAMPADHYVGAGAHSAHLWWEKVLGGKLDDLRARAAALTREEQP